MEQQLGKGKEKRTCSSKVANELEGRQRGENNKIEDKSSCMIDTTLFLLLLDLNLNFQKHLDTFQLINSGVNNYDEKIESDT